MMLFDNLSNSFSFTDEVRFVGMLYFSVNMVLITQCVDLESIRAWKVGF